MHVSPGVLFSLSLFSSLSLCSAALAAGDGAAETIRTHDGLELRFASGGSLDAVLVGGAALPLNGAGGFFVSEVLAEQTPLPGSGTSRPGEPMAGKVARTGPDEVTVTATSGALGITFEGVISGGAALRVKGRLENQRGGDRAFVISFRVPIDATGGTWWGALGSSESLDASTRAYEPFHWYQAYRTTTSALPLAAVTLPAPAAGLALAVPPTHPSIYRLSYQAPHGLQVEWEVGTAPEPLRFPNAARVEALFYRVDSSWPFRSALKRLYLLHPTLWTTRAKHGSWVYDDSAIGTLPDPGDFAIRFVETYLWAGPYTRSHGQYALKYTEPWNDHLEADPATLAAWAVDSATNQGWAQISKGQPRQVAAQAALLSAAIGRDGRYGGYSDPANFTDPEGTLRWVLNPDPELPNLLGFTAEATDVGEVLNRGRSVEEYELFRQWGREPGPEDAYDGLYLDSTSTSGSGWAGWHLFNFRREHFGTTRAPLVFDPQTGRVALSQALSSVESIRHLAGVIHERDGLVMANGAPDPFIFSTAAFCDFVSPGEQYDGSLPRLRAMRAALYQKPTSYLFNSAVSDEEFAHALLYAVFPGGAGVESNRAVYRRWAPLMLEVAEAGWEPLTFARASDPGVLVERYGRLDKGTLHFVVHREEGSGPVVLTLEKAALGIVPGVSLGAVDRVLGEGVSLVDQGDTLEVSLSLGREASRVLAVEVLSGAPGPTRGDVLPPGPDPVPPPGGGLHPGHGDGSIDPGAGAGPPPGGGVNAISAGGCGGCSTGGGLSLVAGLAGFAAFGFRRRPRRLQPLTSRGAPLPGRAPPRGCARAPASPPRSAPGPVRSRPGDLPR